MKALIIGGTKGFGYEISKQLLATGYEITTVSRSSDGIMKYPHYECDVSYPPSWKNSLDTIKEDLNKLDLLACIVGYAEPKPFSQLSIDDWNKTFWANIGYVALTLQTLQNNLLASSAPKVITIGSQWSFKVGCDELVPYTIAKHSLRTLIEDFAERNPRISINNYSVPTMNTPGFRKISEQYDNLQITSNIFHPETKKLASPSEIAKSIISEAHRTARSGNAVKIHPNGKIETIH